MRISIAVVSAVLAAACGGGGSGGGVTGPPPSGIGPAEVTPEALPPGSSGFPGLDWGDSIEAIQAKYPAAELRGDELVLTTVHDRRPATVSFMLTGGSLIAIDVSFTGDFDSMPTCGETFQKVRAETRQVDRRQRRGQPRRLLELGPPLDDAVVRSGRRRAGDAQHVVLVPRRGAVRSP